MGMVYAHINVSVDGYINDGDGGLDWWSVDEEFNSYIDSLLDSLDGMVLGRTAYDALAQFWPIAGPEMSETQRRRMHQLPKYVLSHAPADGWHNSHLLGPDPAAAIGAAARGATKDIAVFAGAGAVMTALGPASSTSCGSSYTLPWWGRAHVCSPAPIPPARCSWTARSVSTPGSSSCAMPSTPCPPVSCDIAR